MPATVFLRTCFWLAAFHSFGLYSQVDSAVKPRLSGYAFDRQSAYNIYGNLVVFGHRLLDTTSFARDIVRTSSKEMEEYGSAWLMFDSFWRPKEGKSIYQLLGYQNPLWVDKWYKYQKETVNKKDLRSLLELANKYLKYPSENGSQFADIFKEQRFSNTSGTAYLALSLNQLKWSFEIRCYEDHLYILVSGEKEQYILDAMHLEQIWKCGKDDKKLLNALSNEEFKESPVSVNDYVNRSMKLSFRQLAALQKVNESEQLKKTDLASAIERLEVACYFWPRAEIRENLKETCRVLYNSNDEENNWDKLNAAMRYIQITQDDSEITRSQFNLLLGNVLLEYSNNEPMSPGHPPIMGIRIKDSYFDKEIPIQDTFNLIGSFDFDQYVGFQLTDEKTRGFFHSLRFASSKESSGGSDYQFFIDALYIYAYLDHSSAFLKSICAVPISDYDYFDSMPFDLLAHLKGGAIDSSVYHEMCALFYLTNLSTSAPENVSEADKIDMASLRYSVYLEALAEHLKYVDNPDLIVEVKEYVLTVLPIYKQKFMKTDVEKLETIGVICGIE